MTSNKTAQTARRLYKKIMNVVPRHEKYYPFQQTTNFGLSLISYPRNLPPLSLSSSLSLSLSLSNNIRLNSAAQSPSLSHEVAMAIGLFSDFDSILCFSGYEFFLLVFSIFVFLILSWSKLSNFVMVLLFGLEVYMTLVFSWTRSWFLTRFVSRMTIFMFIMINQIVDNGKCRHLINFSNSVIDSNKISILS